MATLTVKQEEILKELEKLQDDSMEEVLDFIKFLKIRDGDAVGAYLLDEDLLEKEHQLES